MAIPSVDYVLGKVIVPLETLGKTVETMAEIKPEYHVIDLLIKGCKTKILATLSEEPELQDDERPSLGM